MVNGTEIMVKFRTLGGIDDKLWLSYMLKH